MSYFRLARTPRYSLTFALPLLVIYEAMAALLPVEATAGLRNAADVMLKSAAYAIGGATGMLALGVLLIGGALWLIVRDVRHTRDAPKPQVLAAMMAESAAAAVIFGLVVGVVTARLLGAAGLLGASASLQTLPGAATELSAAGGITSLPLAARLMLSLGAGIYEEIVFRVLLVGALAIWARRVLMLGTAPAGILAAVLGALLFSAFHYIGPYGDALELHSFAFRFVAGLAFSGLYLIRGFGITAWTHALYDVLVLVL